ncbi:alpha/beta fold hydrolase [Geodermatophilus sp. URMC 63]
MDEVVTSADGTRLVVRRVGSGEPVVLLHGSGGGLHSWAQVADRLADGFALWLVARRGHGPSDVGDRPGSFADDVADTRAVLAAAGASSSTGSAHLVGSSYGAQVALHTALAAPGEVRSLALHEPPLFAAGPQLAPVLAEYRARLADDDLAGAGALWAERVAQVPPALLAALTGSPPGDPAEARRSARGSLRDLEALVADHTAVSRWAAVRVPTLLTQGADTWDPVPATTDALAAVLPDAERVVWEGQTHFATSTAPGLVAGTLRGFLHRQR